MKDSIDELDMLVNTDSNNESVIEVADESHAPLLSNRKKPFYTVKQERPNHRVMLELCAQGYNVREIAQMTGYTTVCVNNILRQPATQQTLVDEIQKQTTADERVVEIIKDSVVECVTLWKSVVNDPKARAADRIAAAEKLMERRYGKANQPINKGTDVDLNSLPDSELQKMVKGN